MYLTIQDYIDKKNENNTDSKHEREVLFYGSSNSCYKQNVNCEKRTNTEFDICIILVFLINIILNRFIAMVMSHYFITLY
jgi:hypothetical protein